MYNFEDHKDDEDFVNFDQKIVHIHKVQTRGRKCITMVKGIDEEFDLKKIAKFCKRNFKCHAHIREQGKQTKKSKEDRKNKEDREQEGHVKEQLVFSGDQIAQIKKFLIYMGITIEDNIRVHGN